MLVPHAITPGWSTLCASQPVYGPHLNTTDSTLSVMDMSRTPLVWDVAPKAHITLLLDSFDGDNHARARSRTARGALVEGPSLGRSGSWLVTGGHPAPRRR